MGDTANQTRPPNIQDHKPVKLRESCDSCLIAKVKCGKERPLCKRCLTNGNSCNYSPSSKTGRRNHKNNPNKTTHAAQNGVSISTQTGSPLQPKTALNGPQPLFQSVKTTDLLNGSRNFFGDETPPYTGPPSSLPSASNVMAIDGDPKTCLDHLSENPFQSSDFLDPFLPIFDPEKGFDFSTAPISPSISTGQVTLGNSSPIPQHNSLLQSAKTSSAFLPFARPHSTSHLDQSRRASTSGDGKKLKTTSCDCFAACVQVLQTLHNHSCLLSPHQQRGGGPSFDVVLSTNKDAIESCAAMLGCTKCVAECGKSVVIMMLATVVGKVISLYRAACFLMFGSTNSMQSTAQLAFGAYKVTGENRQLLEIEILLLDLRRVAAVLMAYSERFCNTTSSSQDDESSVYETLKSYLENNLRNVVQYLNAQKTNVSK